MNIFNKKIINKMNSFELGYMFPISFEYDMHYKEMFWLCEPDLPYLDFDVKHFLIIFYALRYTLSPQSCKTKK